MYTNMWKSVVRPKMQTYSYHDVGCYSYNEGANFAIRVDYAVRNALKEEIPVSVFLQSDEQGKRTKAKGTIIYAHTQGGSRREFKGSIHEIIRRGYNFVSFEFRANTVFSEKLLTLGWLEALDLNAVFLLLKEELEISGAALWGRSMGVAASVFFLSETWRTEVNMLVKSKQLPGVNWAPKSCVEAIVLDACYGKFRDSAVSAVQQKVYVPSLLIDLALKVFDAKLKKESGVSLSQLNPSDHASQITCPVFTMVGNQDELVSSAMHIELFKKIGTINKFNFIFQGTHVSSRDFEVLQKAYEFLDMIYDEKNKKNSGKNEKPFRFSTASEMIKTPAGKAGIAYNVAHHYMFPGDLEKSTSEEPGKDRNYSLDTMKNSTADTKISSVDLKTSKLNSKNANITSNADLKNSVLNLKVSKEKLKKSNEKIPSSTKPTDDSEDEPSSPVKFSQVQSEIYAYAGSIEESKVSADDGESFLLEEQDLRDVIKNNNLTIEEVQKVWNQSKESFANFKDFSIVDCLEPEPENLKTSVGPKIPRANNKIELTTSQFMLDNSQLTLISDEASLTSNSSFAQTFGNRTNGPLTPRPNNANSSNINLTTSYLHGSAESKNQVTPFSISPATSNAHNSYIQTPSFVSVARSSSVTPTASSVNNTAINPFTTLSSPHLNSQVTPPSLTSSYIAPTNLPVFATPSKANTGSSNPSSSAIFQTHRSQASPAPQRSSQIGPGKNNSQIFTSPINVPTQSEDSLTFVKKMAAISPAITAASTPSGLSPRPSPSVSPFTQNPNYCFSSTTPDLSPLSSRNTPNYSAIVPLPQGINYVQPSQVPSKSVGPLKSSAQQSNSGVNEFPQPTRSSDLLSGVSNKVAPPNAMFAALFSTATPKQETSKHSSNTPPPNTKPANLKKK